MLAVPVVGAGGGAVCAVSCAMNSDAVPISISSIAAVAVGSVDPLAVATGR